MGIIFIILFSAVVTFIIFGGRLVKNKEIRKWNNGISAKTGRPWIHFDNDSQGGRGYHDRGKIYSGKDEEVNYIWISYNIDHIVKEK